MTESEAEAFVERFEAAWAGRDSQAFLELWHPDGQLHSPFYDRVIFGHELGALNEFQRVAIPDLVWTLTGWTWRGDTLVIEWENSNRYGERIVRWRGVDRFRLRDGRIVEEVVYADTALLRGLRTGEPIEPLLRFPSSTPEADE